MKWKREEAEAAGIEPAQAHRPARHEPAPPSVCHTFIFLFFNFHIPLANGKTSGQTAVEARKMELASMRSVAEMEEMVHEASQEDSSLTFIVADKILNLDRIIEIILKSERR